MLLIHRPAAPTNADGYSAAADKALKQKQQLEQKQQPQQQQQQRDQQQAGADHLAAFCTFAGVALTNASNGWFGFAFTVADGGPDMKPIRVTKVCVSGERVLMGGGRCVKIGLYSDG